jgi:hypothetical protein
VKKCEEIFSFFEFSDFLITTSNHNMELTHISLLSHSHYH